jgi:hypothetical protein
MHLYLTLSNGLMAIQWGTNSLSPGGYVHHYFVRNVEEGRLTVLSVMPLSPSFTDAEITPFIGLHSVFTPPSNWVPLPEFNQLGVSGIWVQMTDDLKHIVYHMAVVNCSNSKVVYALLEAEL